MSLKVLKTKTMGRGVFTTTDIRKGRVVEKCPCITWDQQDENLIQSTKLRFYVFEGNSFKTVSVLALGFGSLYNHSYNNHNATYAYDPKRCMVVIKATRDIKANEQILINYGYNPVKEFNKWEAGRGI